MSANDRVEGVPPEKIAEVRGGPAPDTRPGTRPDAPLDHPAVQRDFNQPYLTGGDYAAGLVGALMIWGPLAAGGLLV